MRLRRYISEEELESDYGDILEWSHVIKDCQPFIKQLKGAHNLLLRGTNKRNPGILKMKPRQDRRPMSMNNEVHILLDKFFKAKFGWMPRSSGVFVSGSLNTALFYGPVNSVWPIGRFKYLWSPQVSDLFSQLTNEVNKVDKPGWSYWIDNPEKLEAIVGTYTDKNLSKAIDGSANMQAIEIMIGCKEYYMIKHIYTTALKKHFNIKMG